MKPYHLFGYILFAVVICCGFGECRTPADPLAVNGGKSAAAQVADTQSKSAALFGVVNETPDVPPPAKRAAEVGRELNGTPTDADAAWARKLAASDAAATKAKAEAAKLADANKALREKLAAAPSPEELAKAKERGDRAQADLDAFAFHSRLAVLAGFLLVAAGGFAAWATDNPKFAGYGFGASLLVNLIPHIVKVVSESLTLKIAIPFVFAALGFAAWQAWRHHKSDTLAAASKVADEATASGDALAAAVEKSGVWERVKAWWAKVF